MVCLGWRRDCRDEKRRVENRTFYYEMVKAAGAQRRWLEESRVPLRLITLGNHEASS